MLPEHQISASYCSGDNSDEVSVLLPVAQMMDEFMCWKRSRFEGVRFENQPIFGCGMSIRSGSMMRHVLGTKASCSPVSSSPYQHILAISHLQPVICALHQVVLRLLNQTALPRLKQFFSGGKSVQHQTPPCYYSSMYLDAGKGWN